MDPCENLANAIIIQAAEDYRMALRKLKRRPNNEDAMILAQECERFFRSAWYKSLTTLDGEELMERLREEVRKKK